MMSEGDVESVVDIAVASLAGLRALLLNARGVGPDKLGQSCDGGEWVPAGARSDLQLAIFKAPVKGSPIPRWRAEIVLPYAPQTVAAAVANHTARCGRHGAGEGGGGSSGWDKDMQYIDEHALHVPEGAVPGAPAGAKYVLLHAVTRAVGPVSAREFLDAAVVAWLPGGAWVSGGVSVESDARAAPVRGTVRGWNGPGGGFVVRPVVVPAAAADDVAGAGSGSGGGGGSGAESGGGEARVSQRVHTRVTYVFHTDIRGWLPHAIVSAAIVGNFGSFFEGLSRHLAATALSGDDAALQREALAAAAAHPTVDFELYEAGGPAAGGPV